MKSFLKTKDYSVTGDEFELLFDADLEMLITTPQPENLDLYYESETYISHTDTKKSLVDKLYHLIKGYSLNRKLSLISSLSVSARTLLDVGAGTGDFLLKAKNKKWITEGVEPNSNARMRALDKGISLLTSIESLPSKKYQVITLWHVLEHLPDLENQILKMLWHLEENGTLVVAVPNYNSYDAKYYGRFWAAYDTPRHLWHFSRKAIEKLFAKKGLKVVKTKPMIFDSFYVSILSERYKSNRKGIGTLVKAFCIGFYSNLSAWRTKEYSSLIYILKKS